MAKILLIVDDAKLAGLLRDFLNQFDFILLTAPNFVKA